LTSFSAGHPRDPAAMQGNPRRRISGADSVNMQWSLPGMMTELK
jgi:hypothetical protein